MHAHVVLLSSIMILTRKCRSICQQGKENKRNTMICSGIRMHLGDRLI